MGSEQSQEEVVTPVKRSPSPLVVRRSPSPIPPSESVPAPAPIFKPTLPELPDQRFTVEFKMLPEKIPEIIEGLSRTDVTKMNLYDKSAAQKDLTNFLNTKMRA